MSWSQIETALGGKRVLLTGHTGFKGPWLLTLLADLDCQVTAIGLPPDTEPSLYDQIRGDDLCTSRLADIADLDVVCDLVAASEPEVVLHLAAQSLVRRSYADPIETFTSNIAGTVNVLEAVRRQGEPCAVLVVTTDKVYAEAAHDVAYPEDAPLGGHDPYSASKAACEIVAQSYLRSYFPRDRLREHGIALSTARAGNVIGGGDRCEDRLIPDLVRAMSADEEVVLRNPSAVRPWQHVLDALSGYLTLTSRLLTDPESLSEAYNFGPGADDALTVETVVEQALEVWGRGGWRADIDPDAPHEAGFLQIDSTRAATELGWTPTFDATEAIAATVAWHRQVDEEGADARQVTQEQARAYVERRR